jgi:hypothetical protein
VKRRRRNFEKKSGVNDGEKMKKSQKRNEGKKRRKYNKMESTRKNESESVWRAN